MAASEPPGDRPPPPDNRYPRGPNGSRHYERYFEVLQYRMSPEELVDILNSTGSPAAIIERQKRVDGLLRKDEVKDAIWQFVKRVAAALVVLLGVMLTLKGLVPPEWWPG